MANINAPRAGHVGQDVTAVHRGGASAPMRALWQAPGSEPRGDDVLFRVIVAELGGPVHALGSEYAAKPLPDRSFRRRRTIGRFTIQAYRRFPIFARCGRSARWPGRRPR